MTRSTKKQKKFILVDGTGRFFRACSSYEEALALCRTSRGTSWAGPSPLWIDYSNKEGE